MGDREHKKKITVHLYPLLSLVAVAFVVGVFVGRGMRTIDETPGSRGAGIFKTREKEFRFTSPVFKSETAPSMTDTELKPFLYKVRTLVEARLKGNDASAVSVYFRDLNNGNWFGIQENEKFSPASLLKIPVMIAYFKWTETNPLILNKKLPYAGADDVTGDQDMKPVKTLKAGRSYAVDDLIFRMIAYADNAAFGLLSADLPAERLRKVHKDLYVDYNPEKSEDYMSLTAYAAFFRVLYNSSYLNREMSEKALSYLSRSSFFKSGIAAAIPPDTDVASKFCERTVRTEDGDDLGEIKQAHEVGIIYYPNRPYLIGIVTRGNDFKKMGNVMRAVSRLVYDEVDRQSRLP
ncbi:MAG TPA: serine hydrolase [Nitrospirota bacterium]|nr:serine hydrolase [Nitrospirota bacterium]